MFCVKPRGTTPLFLPLLARHPRRLILRTSAVEGSQKLSGVVCRRCVCLLDVPGEDDRVVFVALEGFQRSTTGSKEVRWLVSHTETPHGRSVLDHQHGKGTSDYSSYGDKETSRINRGAHRYWRQEATTLRDPHREANIVVEALYKHQASD